MAEKGKNVILEGMVLISDISIKELFDTNVTYSFITKDLVDRLC